MAENHELRLKINAGDAKRGAREFRAAITAVQQAVAELNRDSHGAFTALRKGTRIHVDSSQAKSASVDLDKARRGTEKLEAAQRRTQLSISSAMRASGNEADRLRRKMSNLGDVDGIRQLDAELRRLQSRMSQASSPLDVREGRSSFSDTAASLKNRVTNLEATSRAETEAANTAQRHASELEKLRMKFQPLYAASRQYETALEEISRAEREGVLTASTAASARERAAQQLQNGTTQVTRYGETTRVSGAYTANLAAQFNDIGVTLAAGQSPLLLAVQQGTQVSQVLNQMKTEGGGAVAALRAGFMSMINPVSLATIGIIAGGAALGQWAISALSAANGGKTLEEQLEHLQSLSSGLESSLDTLSLSATDLSKRYGDAASRVRELTEAQAQLRVGQIRDALRSQIADLGELERRYRQAEGARAMYSRGISNIAQDFGISRDAAEDFHGVLMRLARAETFEGQRSALQAVVRHAEEAGIALSAFPPALRDAAINAIELSNESDRVTQLIRDAETGAYDAADATSIWAANMSSVGAEISAIMRSLNALGNGVIDNVSKEAELAALKRGESIRSAAVEAERVRKEAEWKAREMGANPVEKIIIGVERDNWERGTRLDDQIAAAREDARERARKAKRSSRSGSGSSREKLSDYEKWQEQAQRRVESMEAQNRAQQLLISGQVQSEEAARLLAEAMGHGSDMADRQTAAMIRQAEQATTTKKQLEALANDPVRQYIDNLPSLAEARRQLRATAMQSMEDGLTDMFMGEFDADKIAQNLKRAMSRSLAQQVMSSIAPGLSSGIGGGVVRGSQQGAQMMQSALIAGGQTAAAQIRASMAGASAPIPNAGTVPATPSSGGTGNFLGQVGMMALGMFKEGGYSDSPVQTTNVPVSAFRNAPHYSEGTPNTSGGTPAILHPNEAVIPLSRGRKVPVEMNGGGAGAMNTNLTVNIERSGGDESDDELAQRVGAAVHANLTDLMDARIAEATRYGNSLNPRGVHY